MSEEVNQVITAICEEQCMLADKVGRRKMSACCRLGRYLGRRKNGVCWQT